MDFPLYFQKVICVRGQIFWEKKNFFEKAKHTGICTSIYGDVSET